MKYSLREICDCEYVHEPLLAPTQEMLDGLKKKKGDWQEYEGRFLALMAERKIEEKIDPSGFAVATALLCSESTPEHCHRKLVLDYLRTKWKEAVGTLRGVFARG